MKRSEYSFRRWYTLGSLPVLSDLWMYPRWLLFHSRRIAYVPWSFGRTLKSTLRLK